VGISLTDLERSAPFDGDYHARLSALQNRLAQLQLAQIVHGRRAIILFEGWEGAGKKAALKRLTAAWDPCHFAVHAVRHEDIGRSERHWLSNYWSKLPAAGETMIFYRSWYRSIVDARALGELDDKKWWRSLDEINEFEAQQADHGTLLIKLFFHVSAEVQRERLHERGEHPWRRWTLSADDLRSNAAREGYLGAWHEMFDQTDTRWAPWRAISGEDKRVSRLAALEAVADAFEKAIPLEPPARDETVVLLAQEKYA
jgi:AMP-polyphosphate phosphotransferase